MRGAEEDGVKNRAIRCLGLSAVLLIGVLTVWGGLPLGALTQLEMSEILKCWSIPLLIALGLTLGAVLLKRGVPTANCLVAVAVLAGGFVGGGYAMLFVAPDALGRTLIAGASSIFVGIGYGLFSLLWQHVLSRLSFDDMTKTLLLSLALASAEYLLLFAVLGDRLWTAFPLLVVAAIALCLAALRMPAVSVDDTVRHDGRGGGLWDLAKEIGSPLICVCAIAFTVALTRTITLDGIEDSDMINTVANGCIIVASLVLYAAWYVLGSRGSFFGKLDILAL